MQVHRSRQTLHAGRAMSVSIVLAAPSLCVFFRAPWHSLGLHLSSCFQDYRVLTLAFATLPDCQSRSATSITPTRLNLARRCAGTLLNPYATLLLCAAA